MCVCVCVCIVYIIMRRCTILRDSYRSIFQQTIRQTILYYHQTDRERETHHTHNVSHTQCVTQLRCEWLYRVYRLCMILRDSYRSLLRTIRSKYRRHIPILSSITRISFLKFSKFDSSEESSERRGTLNVVFAIEIFVAEWKNHSYEKVI